MKNIHIDLAANTLTVSKSFYKKASVCGSAEYYELRQAKIENPDSKIVFKSIEKKTYNGQRPDLRRDEGLHREPVQQ